MSTSAKGETEITLDVNVNNPKRFNVKNGTFGMAWGFGFKDNESK